MRNYIHFRNFTWIVAFLAMFSSCEPKETVQHDALEQNMIRAGNNRAELEKVLAHYRKQPQDSLKLKVAIFLISNMEKNNHYIGKWLDSYNEIFDRTGSLSDDEIAKLKDSIISRISQPTEDNLLLQNDLRTIKADYLIENIDLAIEAWQQAPWSKSVSFDAFCNYILPYKTFSEYPEHWRTALQSRYQTMSGNTKKDTAMNEVCCKLNEEQQSWFRFTEHFNDYPGRISISNILKGKRGNCSDMANLGAYTARALGIPVAIDFTPQWANYFDGHVWDALILSDSTFTPFLGGENKPGDYFLMERNESKAAKVFRRRFSVSENSFAMQAARAGVKDIPDYLRNSRIIDITSLYTSTGTINLSIDDNNGKPIYLCLFQKGNWQAIAGSFIKDGQATFTNMGRNILYAPMFFENNTYQFAGVPVLLPISGAAKEIIVNEEQQQSMTLYRKYPLKRERAKWNLAQYFYKCRIEGANLPNFKDAQVLYTITNPFEFWGIMYNGFAIARDRLKYEGMWEDALINTPTPYRYYRLIANNEEDDPLKVGELEFLANASTIPLKGKPIGSVQNPAWAFDGVHGYSIIEKTPNHGQWVGVDFGIPTVVNKVRYLPANDKNTITPDKTYELFYWTGEWTSLGVQKATKHALNFEKTPTGGIYWLHCRDCGSFEERPFTYENNEQIWW